MENLKKEIIDILILGQTTAKVGTDGDYSPIQCVESEMYSAVADKIASRVASLFDECFLEGININDETSTIGAVQYELMKEKWAKFSQTA